MSYKKYLVRQGRSAAGALLPSFIRAHVPRPLSLLFEPGIAEYASILDEHLDVGRDTVESEIRMGKEHYTDISQSLVDELGEDYWEQYRNGPGVMPEIEASVLYALIRILKPKRVVETGVAQGSSTAMILRALDSNDYGHLDSIDLPRYANNTDFSYREGDFPIEGFSSAVIPEGKDPGWLVDVQTADRWTLHIGRSTQQLVDVIDAQDVDVFIHDSEHSYKNILWELSVAAPSMRTGGWMWVDDATWNSAANDFGAGVSWPMIDIGRAKLLHVTENFAESHVV